MPRSHCEPILTAAVRKLALDRVAGLHDGLTEAGLAERNLLTQLSDIALHLVAEVADAVSQVGQPVIQLAELLAVEDSIFTGLSDTMITQGGQNMKQKYHLAMDDAERRLLIGSLNDLRSRLFTEGRYTDAVDEVLLKIIGAKRKKFKIVYTE